MMEKNSVRGMLRDVSLLLIGSLIYGIGIYMFVVPANIAPGGASGIALMVNFVTGLPVGTLTLVLNVPLLILAWFYLSKKICSVYGNHHSCLFLRAGFCSSAFYTGLRRR